MPNASSPSPCRRAPLVLALGWLLLVTGGFGLLARHQFAAGAASPMTPAWPDAASLRPAADRPTLLLFAHPRCPCTRTSLGELREIMARCGDRVAAQVLFYKPGDFAADWEKTDLWQDAATIPGVVVTTDVDGVTARAFGARTSGQVLLYGADGVQLFRGGITLGRGHAGDNPGRAAIVTLVAGEAIAPVTTPVFGCSLADRSEIRPAPSSFASVQP